MSKGIIIMNDVNVNPFDDDDHSKNDVLTCVWA